VARIGSKQGIFAPCEKRRWKKVKPLKLIEKKMKNILMAQIAGQKPPAIWAGIRRKAPILVDIRARFCDST